MAKQKYYDTKEIDKTNAKYRLIIGIRSNGKTTAVLGKMLINFCESNYKNSGAYIRRYREDLKGIANVTNTIVNLGWVEKFTKGEYNSIQYFRQVWRLVKLNDKGEKIKTCTEPFMYAFDIATQERYKSQSFPNIKTICFDEFITRNYYLVDEFILFQNLLSTIIRERNDVVIYMLGNTVNKYNPYFEEMGLTNAKKQKQDTIDIYEYGQSGLKVAIEYCKGISKKSDVYFAFDNPRLLMISKGDWEIDLYPHLPLKYKIKDKLFSYYIEFKDELFECEVIYIEDNLFTFIHRKTTPIKEEIYPVYTSGFNPKLNYSHCIYKPRNKVEKFILSQFNDKKICYQSNEVGEVIRNFLMLQEKRSI